MRSKSFSRVFLVGTIAICVTTFPTFVVRSSGQSRKTMTVKSAARAERFGAGDTELRGKHQSEVVLVVRLEGISGEDWEDLAERDLAVSADARRFQARRKMIATTTPDSRGGVVTKPLTVVVFVVPRDQLKFTLLAGKWPPISFTAETKVQQVLSQ